jgi:hypothetical protein
MILDSTLFEPYFNDRASYLLGNEALGLKNLWKISMPGQDEEWPFISEPQVQAGLSYPLLRRGTE